MTTSNTGIDRNRSLLTTIATFGMILYGILASSGYLNGTVLHEISDKFPSPLSTATYVYSIWNLVFASLAIFSLFQLRKDLGQKLRPIRGSYILSCALTCVWFLLWLNGWIELSLAAISLLFIILVTINSKLSSEHMSGVQALFVKVPLGLYLGWTLALAFHNFATLLSYYGIWSDNNRTVFGVLLILLCSGIVLLIRIKITNYIAPLAVAWYLTAIAIAQSGKTLIVTATALGVVACLIAAISFVLRLKGSSDDYA